MGAYLTQPITEKVSEDKSFKGMTYGVSSMQGWRITQEDAHNCITDFDSETDTSVFAVYDGHGGSEVAQYCALHLPDFIKSLPEYKTGDLAECSHTAFIQFDATLTEERIIKELKVLAGDDDGEDEDETSATPCVHSEAEMLKAEANMPLDQLLSKYEHLPPGLPLRNLRKSEQISSPMIHAKKTVISHCDEAEVGGSNNCVSSSDSNNSNNSSIAISLDDKLLTNGHADNENNLNKEKEIQDNLNSKHVSNSSESLSDDKKLDNIKSNDSEPSSSTDKINPVNKITTEAECSSTVGSCEQSSKSEVTLSSLSIASSLVESSSSVTPSKTGGSGSSCSTTSDSGITTSTLEVSSNSQLSSSTGCSSSSSSEPSAASSSGQGGSASSSSEVGNSSSEGSVSVRPACSSSSEAGSSSSTGDRNKGAIFGLREDDSDDDDDEENDEEYEDMDSDEEDGEEEEDETEESVEHPYMDMSNEEPGSDSGCTACFTILRGKQLIVANAGDSRCVMSKSGIAVELSFDHKPEDDIEKKRIEKAGGKVTADGRVNGGLNLSRALGDHWYKRNGDLSAEEQMISASPDIQSVMLDDEDEFIVVACDGIWNYLSSQEVVDYVRERLTSEEKRQKPSMICEEMFDYCLAPNTFGDGTGCDNMTCIIIVLHPEREPAIINRKRSTDEMDNSVTDEVQLKKKAKVEEVTNSCNVDKNEIVDGQAVSSESN